MKLALVDYGIGNVMSVANALHRVGADTEVVRDGDALTALNPDCIVMPGVGAVGEALSLLRERGLDEALNRFVIDQSVSYLGICVGMQVMASVCEEFGEHRGLGWIPGKVTRLVPEGSPLRLPHVGWNTISVAGEADFLAGLDGEHFYFVHSYGVECPGEFVAARSEYGQPFIAAVQHGHMKGVQFHPEKSSRAGEALLRGFVESAALARV